MKHTVTSVDVGNQEQTMTLTWSDGLEASIPLFGLRKNCPCVECRGGHDQMGTYESRYFFVEPTRQYKIRRADVVGNHALKIHWDDGHNTGMYRWDLLRSFCEALQ